MDSGKSHSFHPGTAGRGILVVDDERVIRDMCAMVLDGYQVFMAADGLEALDILEREKVDVILTDVMMPNMNGLDLLEAIKKKDPNKAVVVMTGYSEKNIILRALKANADDFISKPINMLQLKTTLDNVLEKKALKEELLHLKRMDRLKSDFLGLVSHKLKTPATAISLFIQNLAHGSLDKSDPGFSDTLTLILEESEYLATLIQDLLTYSDVILQDGPPTLTRCNLKDLALGVFHQLKYASQRKGIALSEHIEGDFPDMELDRERLIFAIRALLDNAIKFTATGGAITLSGQAGPDQLVLKIVDNGEGISRENLPKIFEKFYQVDPSHAGQIRGFGLGLHYAREFVQAHQGTIQIESRPGIGTTATLTFPR
ncbi:response regulator [Desulfuromonas sp. AOP6]|uniref:hybrid sensor histidine kinase/response regulator n=1 Tax=Desulfuromonas sp. AOP6 TaxID=1566351 RepID=UPI00127FF13D|nr:response regulator [Desulfuromonas sp. AOP6]BCA78788.1 hybrid sensor histidine kinase/response regulator [Desulfuromonas sp. AOP6]